MARRPAQIKRFLLPDARRVNSLIINWQRKALQPPSHRAQELVSFIVPLTASDPGSPVPRMS